MLYFLFSPFSSRVVTHVVGVGAEITTSTLSVLVSRYVLKALYISFKFKSAQVQSLFAGGSLSSPREIEDLLADIQTSTI